MRPDVNILKKYALSAPTVVKALKSRRFEAYFCETAEEAAKMALSLIPEGSSVSWGGSLTIREIGLLDRINAGNYILIDRDKAETPEERYEIMRRGFFCDTYLTSVNALSEDGILVNVDGIGNRVAAMTFGPKNVVVIAGMNKLCPSEEDAERRARKFASPANSIRLELNTPCVKTGLCSDCKSADCICTYIIKTRMSRPEGRIKVILVGEQLGL
jgi:L-lactate utilization protein LutB